MVRSILPILVFCLVYSGLNAQTAEGCDGTRYKDKVFTDVKKTTVQYGSNKNQAGATITLSMDVYEPVGDNVSKRPTLVLAHGGSFVFGNKTDLTAMCTDLAQRGYVAASISYRLYPFLILGFPDSAAVLETAILAMGDMKAAIRYLREDAATSNQFKVDPDFLISGGYSAGAVVGIAVGMLDSMDNVPQFIRDVVATHGGFEGNTSTNYQYPSEVMAVMNRSGGIYRTNWIDANDPPMASMHGTADDVVFYNTGLANGLLYLDGSGVMHPHMDNLGIPNYLNTVQGGGHTDIYFDAAYSADYIEYQDLSAVLFEGLLCGTSNAETPINNQMAQWQIIPNPNNGTFFLDFPSEKGFFDLQILDVQGKTVYENFGLQGQSSLNTQLPKGLYWLRITEENKQVSVGRLLISE